MSNFHNILIWLGLMCPLIFSPGPANLSVAGLAAQKGIKGSIPFIAGISTINICLLLFIGLAFGQLHQAAPTTFKVIELLGALYVCYLSKCFLNPSKTKNNNQLELNLGYKHGLLLQILNGKFYPTSIMMFATFLNNPLTYKFDVLIISIMLTVLAIISYILWGTIGTIITNSLDSKKANFVQRYVFGGMLLSIGIWLIYENLLYWLG